MVVSVSRFRLVLLTCLLIPFAPPPSALAHGSHGGGGESLEPGEFNFSPLVTVEGHGGFDTNLEGSPKHYAVDGLFGGVFEWGLENGGSIAVEAAVGPSLVWGEAEHFYGKVHTHGGHDHGGHGDSHGDSHSDHAGEHDDHDDHDHGDHGDLTKKQRRQRRMLRATSKQENREGRLARLELRRLRKQSNGNHDGHDDHQGHDDHDHHDHDDHGHHARRSFRSADDHDDHDHDDHDHDHDHADHEKRDREELLAHREHVNRLKARAYNKYNDDHAGHDDHGHGGHDDHGHGGHDDHDGHGNPNFKRSDVRGFLSVRYAPNDRLSFAINWNPYYVTENEGDDIKGLKNEVGANVVWALGDGDVDFALGDGLEDLVDGVFLSLDHRQGWESDGTYVGNYTDPRIGVGFNIDEVNITLDAGPRFYVPGSYSGLGQRTDFAAEVEVAIPVGDALIFAHWQPTYSGTDAPGWGVGWQHHIGTGITFKF